MQNNLNLLDKSGAPIGLPPVICSACGSKPYRPWDATHLLRCGNWNCEHHKPQNCKPLAEWNRFHSQNVEARNGEPTTTEQKD